MAAPRDISNLVVPEVGQLLEDPSLVSGYGLTDVSGEPITAVAAYLRHTTANDFASTSPRSYALSLLRWFRFLSAIGVGWTAASTTEYIDFVLWMRQAAPRHGGRARKKGEGYAPRTINHTTTVLRGFYDFHARAGSGPVLNPIHGLGTRVADARYAGQTYFGSGRALGRQRIPRAAPKSIPDDAFDELFAMLACDRDRALVALYLSTGARANELLTVTGADLDFGENRIQVVRKGGERQWVQASPDAMVWLRLYLGTRRLELDESVWLTRRKPLRPLEYAACRAVFVRAQRGLPAHYTLHQLRHTAAYRMIQDPTMDLTDVQWVLGHLNIGTTLIYTQARPEDVLAKMAEHHKRPRVTAPTGPIGGAYNPDSMKYLFGVDR